MGPPLNETISYIADNMAIEEDYPMKHNYVQHSMILQRLQNTPLSYMLWSSTSRKRSIKCVIRLLMDKIRNLSNIDLNIANRIQDFLTGRTQRVVIRGTESAQLPLESGSFRKW